MCRHHQPWTVYLSLIFSLEISVILVDFLLSHTSINLDFVSWFVIIDYISIFQGIVAWFFALVWRCNTNKAFLFFFISHNYDCFRILLNIDENRKLGNPTNFSNLSVLLGAKEGLDRQYLSIQTARSNVFSINPDGGSLTICCLKLPKDTDASTA